jgi:hypothetical protein
MNKQIYLLVAGSIIATLGVLATTIQANAQVPIGCTGDPHDRDAPTGNPHDDGEYGNPHDSAKHHHGGAEGPDNCPGAQ